MVAEIDAIHILVIQSLDLNHHAFVEVFYYI